MHNIVFIIISILCILTIVVQIRKKAFAIKESFWWFIVSCVMLLLSIFPHSIDIVAKWMNIQHAPSLLFVLCIIFLSGINFRLSAKMASCQNKIKDLAQEISIIKEKINK